MRRDDRWDDIFNQIERMMNEMMGSENVDVNFMHGDAGFGADTHVDIQEANNQIRVLADLPGVEKQDIDLTCDGQVLTISATSEQRQYDEKVRLPVPVDENSGSAKYNNGVLEITFDRADEGTSINVS